MSDINILILEDIANLVPYNNLNKTIRAANSSYRNAIKAHNAGDSLGFANHMANHRQHEIQLHHLLSHPKTFLTNGKHISDRRKSSAAYLRSFYLQDKL